MHPGAVGLVLLSAVAHVYWNFQVKRSPQPAIFTWWLLVTGVLLFCPIAVWLAWPITIPATGWYCVGGTALCYAAYFRLITMSYDREDFSRAYPIARGVAPAATAVWGILFHRENPSLAGALGIAGITLGVLTLGLSSLRRASGNSSAAGMAPSSVPLAGILAAVGTGLCTSGYSAIDKEGVRQVHPALYIVLTFAAGALLLGAQLRARHPWRVIAAEPRRDRAGLILGAVAMLGGYLLVLEALRTAPVSYVVPLRSVAVPLSVFTGARWLAETEGSLRFGAAVVIFLGIAAIALGG